MNCGTLENNNRKHWTIGVSVTISQFLSQHFDNFSSALRWSVMWTAAQSCQFSKVSTVKSGFTNWYQDQTNRDQDKTNTKKTKTSALSGLHHKWKTNSDI